MIILHVVIHPKVSMAIFPQEFHEDDEYNRGCTAFKVGWFRYWNTASTTAEQLLVGWSWQLSLLKPALILCSCQLLPTSHAPF